MNTFAEPVQTLDLRQIAPPERHPLIFSRFDSLPDGHALDLVNDHDPVPLHRQFERMRPGQFEWHYLQAGPALWQVRISQLGAKQALAAAAADSPCCGGCSCR
jgi:uncharacterized protein (DUF2249 family)